MNVAANRSLLFLVAAAACFVVALLIAIDAITSSNFDAWLAGGLLSFTLAHIP